MKWLLTCLPVALMAMLGLPQPLRAAEVLVSGPEALMQALSHAEGGEVIRMAPGDYGKITLGPASSFPVSFPAPGITLRSADPAHPAVFSGLVLKAVDNLSFEDVTFDYSFGLGDLPFTMPFSVTGGDHIAFRNSRFLGDNAHGIGSAENGFGYATGLSLRNVDGAEIDGNLFTTFRNGIQIQSSQNITFQNNDVTDMRSDGLDLAGVTDVMIRGNHFHDFRGMLNWIDHRDMIQLWSTGMSVSSQNITIAGNLFDIGRGSFTQTIFLRNELVDQKQAGPEMAYRNIRILGNTLYNNHRHAITVGETDGLQIAHNAVIEVPDSSPTAATRSGDPASYRPTINVAPTAQNVAITQNAALAITGYSDQPDWRLSDNVTIQDQAQNLPGYYGRIFVSSTLQPGAANHRYLARLDAPLGRSLAGSPAILQPAPTGSYEARFSVTRAEKDPLSRIFDAEASTGPDGQHLPATAQVFWQFGDGQSGMGRRVLHRYAHPGVYHVTLRLAPTEGAAALADLVVTLSTHDLLRFDPTTGSLLLQGADGPKKLSELPIAVPPGDAMPALLLDADHPAIPVPAPLLSALPGAPSLRLELLLRASAPQSGFGELLRLSDSMVLSLLPSGGLQLWLATEDAAPVTLRSAALPLLDGKWHRLEIAFDGTLNQVRLSADGHAAAEAETGGRLRSRPGTGLILGAQGSGRGFSGYIGGLSLSLAPSPT